MIIITGNWMTCHMICYIFLTHISSFAQSFFSTHSIISAALLKLLPVFVTWGPTVLGLVTVISHYYKEMWSSFLESDLRHCKLISIPHGSNKMGRLLIQQRPSMSVVWEMFPQCVTSWKSNAHWPPCSPDLSACDHFLCGPLKVKCIPQEEML